MYILKNAYLNIVRSIGRNILIGIIICTITIGSCIAITINKSGNNLVKTYHDNNPLEVTLNLDNMSFREATDEEKEAFNLLDIDIIKKIGELSTVNSFYYTLQSNLDSDTIEPISYEDLYTKPSEREEDPSNSNRRPQNFPGNMSNGDFSIIAYSDISYNEDFINGDKKLLDGVMIDKDNTDNNIVISEELANENNLKVGDKITLINTNDSSITYEEEIVGIYSIVNDNSDTPGMKRMMSNPSNQIITNLTVINQVITDDGTDASSYEGASSLSSVFYIDYEDTNKFTKQVRDLGVSEYYAVRTNENEITASLEPIKNISSFSYTFLIVILIVGSVVLTIINLFNIRERKYEIGVLRAIGMTKFKVTLQLVCEIFIVSLVALVIGTGIGSITSQPVSNYMLKNEIQSYKNNQNSIKENFGNGNFNRPGFNDQGSTNRPSRKEQSTINTENYISSLTVNTDVTTIIELFGISLLLTILSGVVAITSINKYEPNKILQSRG